MTLHGEALQTKRLLSQPSPEDSSSLSRALLVSPVKLEDVSAGEQQYYSFRPDRAALSHPLGSSILRVCSVCLQAFLSLLT